MEERSWYSETLFPLLFSFFVLLFSFFLSALPLQHIHIADRGHHLPFQISHHTLQGEAVAAVGAVEATADAGGAGDVTEVDQLGGILGNPPAAGTNTGDPDQGINGGGGG